MEFTKSTFEVSRGLTYSYIHIEPQASFSKPYVLFLHGWPSIPTDFHHQISYLSKAGYGILAPELLGYGDTSRPSDSDFYRLKKMAQDLVEILDHHSIPSVLGVGHDWGVTLLTRLEFYHPNRVVKMALLAISCAPFGQPFDLDRVNSMTKQQVGYEGFGYQALLTRDPDAAQLLNSHQDSFRSLMFTTDHDLWKEYFGAIGGLKRWLQENHKTETLDSFTEQMRKDHENAFSNDKGGYSATINWYSNHVFGKNHPDEQQELKDKGVEGYQTNKPVLQILAAKEAIALAPVHKQMAEAYAPQVKTQILPTGHWVMLEAADSVNQELMEFF